MNKTNEIVKEKYDESAKVLNDLSVGTQVLCQNQDSKKWDRSGSIVEVHKHRQYTIKMDGTGRLSLRNRRHLRPVLVTKPITPVLPTPIAVQELPTPCPTQSTKSETVDTTARLRSTIPRIPNVPPTPTSPSDQVPGPSGTQKRNRNRQVRNDRPKPGSKREHKVPNRYGYTDSNPSRRSNRNRKKPERLGYDDMLDYDSEEDVIDN